MSHPGRPPEPDRIPAVVNRHLSLDETATHPRFRARTDHATGLAQRADQQRPHISFQARTQPAAWMTPISQKTTW